ncbi:ABC transporter permease [Pseudoleptotrichia goodfellowii]|uniref:Inner-membrane translocator n=1 Tax=Pseudoleptotrichia goodfellowii TaxID=157692 RepID=A0A510JDW9_9FUSO|nr:ABC transporter permease [Pseudoleptotrichia goodfellowii]BBM36435.1 inner-membrane translocator [Pseudoleptotrichia goodfellowii]
MNILAILIFLIKQTLIIAPPILITAVGACISERSGVVNIGLEGIMLSGAFATTVVNLSTGNPYLGIIVGVITGGLISLIHAVISINLKGDQIISGVALNLFAVAMTSFLIKTIYGVAGSTPSAQKLADKYVVLAIIYILAILTHFLVFKTVLGLRIRAVGEHPLAADTVGINVYKIRYISVILSGMFAGLGGAYLTAVMLPAFSNNMSAGRGFMAMAAMIFGKWNPIGAILASLLFAFGQAFADYAKTINLPIPQQFLSMIPYVLTLLALVGFVGKAKAPKASGQPYEK